MAFVRSPRVIAAVLIVLILVNAALLVWRWQAIAQLPPGDFESHYIRVWEREVRERPDDPFVWATLAGLHESAGNERRASATWARTLELDPDNTLALLYFARQARDAGDFDAAREQLDSALVGLPEGNRALVHYEIGALEEAAGDPAAALTAYRASVADRATYWNAHLRIALLEEDAGNLQEALASAREAARFAPDEPAVSEALARISAAVGGSDTN